MSGVLLVGATGPLGTAIARELRAAGRLVHGVSRSGGAGATSLDVTDPEAVRAILRSAKPTTVIDLSRPEIPSGGADADRAVDAASRAYRQFLTVCADEGIERMIFASSAAIYGTDSPRPRAESEPVAAIGPYARLKLASERELEAVSAAGGFSALALRIFNVYGPGFTQSLVTRLVSRDLPKPTVLVSDEYVRDYIHARDVARAVVAAIDAQGVTAPVLNIGTGVGTSNRTLVGLVPRRSYVVGDAPVTPSHSVADMTLARAALDLPPCIPLSEALAAWDVSSS